MPEEGIRFLPKDQLLSYEELERLSRLFIDMGVDKIRITGGEPFVRKDVMGFLSKLAADDRLNKLSITTNGILTKPYLPQLKELGIKDINLSLDTTDKDNFKKITRRDDFDKVMDTFYQMLDDGFNVKINAVVMDGINDHEIVNLARLATSYPVSVRFIEEMPFNGSGTKAASIRWNHVRILEEIEKEFGTLARIPVPANSTAEKFAIPGASGDVGIIAAYTRTFCGSCDRIRITSTGEMRTCLYGHDVLDLKKVLREGHSDDLSTTANQ